MFSKIRHSRVGFTLIELLVGMTIFSVALTSIYLLLTSTMKSVTYSRNEIIVSNLLREQMELMRNIRDSNIAKGAAWDAVLVNANGSMNETQSFSGGTFIIQNNFDQNFTKFNENSEITSSPVYMEFKSNISAEQAEGVIDNNTLKDKFEKTQLCFDDQKRYVHCKDDTHKTSSGTVFASYINIIPMYFYNNDDNETKTDIQTKETIIDDSGKEIEVDKNQGYIIDARVIVRDGSYYREYDARTALTDWQK